jgi:hypothetical protein
MRHGRARKNRTQWDSAWEQCCYGFIADPDLERLHFEVLATLLSETWGIALEESVLEEISHSCEERQVAEAERLPSFKAQIAAAYRQGFPEGENIGRRLGEWFLRAEVPPILTEMAEWTLISRTAVRCAAAKFRLKQVSGSRSMIARSNHTQMSWPAPNAPARRAGTRVTSPRVESGRPSRPPNEALRYRGGPVGWSSLGRGQTQWTVRNRHPRSRDRVVSPGRERRSRSHPIGPVPAS